MKISQIYEHYSLTKTLQEHMIRAAAVGKTIAENTSNLRVDKERIIRVLLLHDTGNIIKFDFDMFPHLLGAEIEKITYWKSIQKKIIKKYGTDEHHATESIAREIGIASDIQSLLEWMIYSQIKEAAENTDWEQKICQYADMRCGPFGIIDIEERFDDLIQRYKHRNHKISNLKKTEENRKYMRIIEQQLQKQVKIPLKEITEDSVSNLYPKLKNTEMHPL